MLEECFVIIASVNMRGCEEEVSSSVSVARYWNVLKKSVRNVFAI